MAVNEFSSFDANPPNSPSIDVIKLNEYIVNPIKINKLKVQLTFVTFFIARSGYTG